jgi:hypothetical protein
LACFWPLAKGRSESDIAESAGKGLFSDLRPDRDAFLPLNTNQVDLVSSLPGDSVFQDHGQTRLNGVRDIALSFLFRVALGQASGNLKTFRHNAAVVIFSKDNVES